MTGFAQDWQADRYVANAAFVAELGLPVLALLAPVAGERVLDLGCGDGALTLRLQEMGCRVVGVDAGADMIRQARAHGLEAHVVDGHDLAFDAAFDAVFSNAALHWMKRDPQAVLKGVARALVPGGRFVAEFGGHGNVAAIRTALIAVLERRGLDARALDPWYFPSVAEYRERLEAAGFTVHTIELIPRPTPLPTGMRAWLATFAEPLLKAIPAAERSTATGELEQLLAPALRTTDGQWVADYVRLRFAAAKTRS